MSQTNSITLDPGGTHTIMDKIHFILAATVLAVGPLDIYKDSHTEIDYHANIPVVVNHAYVMDDNGLIPYANAFTPDYITMIIPFVCASIKY